MPILGILSYSSTGPTLLLTCHNISHDIVSKLKRRSWAIKHSRVFNVYNQVGALSVQPAGTEELNYDYKKETERCPTPHCSSAQLTVTSSSQTSFDLRD